MDLEDDVRNETLNLSDLQMQVSDSLMVIVKKIMPKIVSVVLARSFRR